jgi:preprotein translocase subunit SecD
VKGRNVEISMATSHYRPLLGSLLLAAAAAAASGCSAEPEPPRFVTALIYRTDDWQTDPDTEASATDIAAALEERLERSPVAYQVSVDKGQVEVRVPKLEKEAFARLQALLTTRGRVTFRLVCDLDVARAERAKRDVAGALYQPPEGFSWVPHSERREDRLLITPELASQAALAREEAKVPIDPARIRELQEQLDRVREQSVFGSPDFESVEAVLSDMQAWVVTFELKEHRKAAFVEFTRAAVGSLMAIVGDDGVLAAPIINDELPGAGVISGGGAFGFERAEAEALAIAWSTRPLPKRLVLIEERDL